MSAIRSMRIVIVADDAGRGEAQFFLLHLLRHLHDEGAAVDVYVWRGGGLLDEYGAVASTRDLDDLNRWLVAKLCERLRLRRIGQALKNRRLRWWLRRVRNADVVYLSGAQAARICGFLPDGSPPVVTHLHGDGALPAPDRSAIVERTERFVVSSDEAERNLVEIDGVPAERVERQDYLLLVDALALSSGEPPSRADLGIPDDAVVVAGAGTVDWWAAPDPFVLLAWAVAQRAPDTWFVWIAPESGARELWPLRHDIANAGVADRFVIVDSPASIDALDVADIFVLATREDRHVRLTIEAARRSLPVVCSEGVGTVLGSAPVTVSYLDDAALAEVVHDLVADADRRAQLGAAVVEAAGQVHDTESGVTEVTDVLWSVAR